MPAKRRSMADFLAEQRAIEDPLAGDPRPGLAAVPELADTPPPPGGPGPFPASAVPVPHSPTGHGQLSGSEEADLAVCEAALDNLRIAFWAGGKALQVIRDARLYRAEYDTFDDYVEQRWGMGKSQAYRLIEAWPLAERLSPIGERLTESHVRELVRFSGRHGEDAAAVVYETVAGTDGVQVTAAVLHDVVGILPADYFDADEAVAQIRAYLAGDRPPPPGLPPADPVQAFTKPLDKLQRANPDLVRRVVAGIRAKLDEIERAIDG